MSTKVGTSRGGISVCARARVKTRSEVIEGAVSMYGESRGEINYSKTGKSRGPAMGRTQITRETVIG